MPIDYILLPWSIMYMCNGYAVGSHKEICLTAQILKWTTPRNCYSPLSHVQNDIFANTVDYFSNKPVCYVNYCALIYVINKQCPRKLDNLGFLFVLTSGRFLLNLTL